jgi:ABC-2 type transport system permease protein
MFPRPIRKVSFFIGKALSCYAVCGLVVLLYYVICIILSLSSAGGVDPNVFGSLGMAMLFMFGAGGFALLMSSLFKKGSTAVIITIAMLLLILNIVDSMLTMFGVEPVYSIVYAGKDILNFIEGHPQVINLLDTMPPHMAEAFEGLPISLKIYYPTHELATAIALTWGAVGTAVSAFLFKRREF